MTHYFIISGHSTAPKNKPQHEASDYLKSLQGKLILVCDIEESKEVIIEKIKSISESNPRCKPLSIEFTEMRHDKTIWMKGFDSVSFKFVPAVFVPYENLWSCLS